MEICLFCRKSHAFFPQGGCAEIVGKWRADAVCWNGERLWSEKGKLVEKFVESVRDGRSSFDRLLKRDSTVFAAGFHKGDAAGEALLLQTPAFSPHDFSTLC